MKDKNIWVEANEGHTTADETQSVPEVTPTKEPMSSSLESPPKKQKTKGPACTVTSPPHTPEKQDPFCDILGDNYDLANPTTSKRVDTILSKLIELRSDGLKRKYKESRGHDTVLVRVPNNKSNSMDSFMKSKDWVDGCVNINGSTKNLADHYFVIAETRR